jgi:hypothetical protein
MDYQILLEREITISNIFREIEINSNELDNYIIEKQIFLNDEKIENKIYLLKLNRKIQLLKDTIDNLKNNLKIILKI